MASYTAGGPSGHRVQCDKCGMQIPAPNMTIHAATCRGNGEAGQSMRTDPLPGAGNNYDQDGQSGSGSGSGKRTVSLFTAYLLWLLLGPTGLHHAYLGRPRHGLLCYSTLAFFGFGWIYDFFRLPTYVRYANADPSDPEIKIRNATVEARGGVPRIGLLRILAMSFFGWYFGNVASCVAILPDDAVWVYRILYAAGAAVGVGMAANAGDQTTSPAPPSTTSDDGDGVGVGLLGRRYKSLVGGCILGSVLNVPTLGGIVGAVRARRYREGRATADDARQNKSLPGRLVRHLVWCTAFSSLLTLALFNHGSVNVNGRPVYFREAAENAYNSDFWREFEWDQFRGSFGGEEGDGSDYLKRTFDLSGERRARRILGVGKGAAREEVKSAYKKLALRYHPDKMAADATSEERETARERFVEVQEAYEIMKKAEQEKKESRRNREGGGERGSYGRDEM